MDFNRLATLSPVNKDAALMRDGRGDEFLPRANVVDFYDDCPSIKHKTARDIINPNFVDYTGQSFGRLTVIGMMAGKNKKRLASWVCRCQCGRYCSRSSRTLRDAARNGNVFQDRCGMCRYTARLRMLGGGSK